MKDIINEKIYIGQTHRFIIDQRIGFTKLLDVLGKDFEVKELRDQENTIVLVEEKEKEEKAL